MKYLTNNFFQLIILIFSTIILFYSCSVTSTESGMMKNIKGVKMTRAELAIRLDEFGKYLAGRVEEAANEIIEKSDDRQIKMNALEWKINVIPKAFESLVITDPLAAGIDITALCFQQEEFFTTGYGKDLFGKYQFIAVEAGEEIVSEVVKLGDDFREKEYRADNIKEIEEWVKANPIKSLQFNRRSTIEIMAKALGSENLGLGESVGSIAEGVYELEKQIAMYTDYMPKTIKWQAQLTSYEILSDSIVEKTFTNLDRIVDATERITKIVEETPSLLTNLQRSTLEEINKQILLTLSTLSNERQIILDELKEERVAVMSDINLQRIQTLESIDKLTEKTMNQSSLIAGDLVDKVFIRILILLALIFVGAIIIVKVIKK